MTGNLDETRVLADLLIEQLQNSNASKSLERKLDDEINKLNSQFDEAWSAYKDDERNGKLNIRLIDKHDYILKTIHHDITVLKIVKNRLFN